MDINIDDLISLYNSGMSVNKLAKKFGCSRSAIGHRLKQRGITPRNMVEARRLWGSQMTQAEKAHMTAAAHAATKGVPQPYERLCERAITIERNYTKFASDAENIFADMLRSRGLDITQQKAIGKYNIDIAINKPPIAVEIFGGGWHSTGRHMARFQERVKYLADCGYRTIIIWANGCGVTSAAADYIISFIESTSFDEPINGDYWMIRGDGKPTTAGKHYFDGLPGKPGPCARDKITGRFTSSVG